MNDRMLEAIKKLKEKQDDLGIELKQLSKEFEKTSSLNMQEAILRVADDLARYTIQDGYWYYNGKDTGIKAEGIDGKDGIQGPQGIPGRDGKPGKDGKSGKDGKPGKDGKNGLPGRDGKDGKPGKDGKDGKDGITPLIKIGKVESSDTYGGADVKMRFGKGNIIYLDFTLPMGRPGFPGLDGKDAKINGKNTINIEAGDNIDIEQDGNTLVINSTGGGGNVDDVKVNGESVVDENKVANINLTNYVEKSDIKNNVVSTDTDKPLSANMGKELNDRIQNLASIGKYLAMWNCETGLPTTNPVTMPYTYTTGDYYVISNVDITNYMPNGSTYSGTASSTQYSGIETLNVGDFFYYDGTVWTMLKNTGKTVYFANIAGNPTDNSNLASALNDKVGFTDYATTSKVGVVKGSSTYALTVSSTGAIYPATKTYSSYNSGSDQMFICKKTLENVITGKGLVSNTDYASQNTGGVAKMWTSTNEDDEIGLNISTQ